MCGTGWSQAVHTVQDKERTDIPKGSGPHTQRPSVRGWELQVSNGALAEMCHFSRICIWLVPPACSLMATCSCSLSIERSSPLKPCGGMGEQSTYGNLLVFCASPSLSKALVPTCPSFSERKPRTRHKQSCQACADTGFPHSSPIREVLFVRTLAHGLTSRTKEPTSKAGSRPIISF